jgi:hypothetical protein
MGNVESLTVKVRASIPPPVVNYVTPKSWTIFLAPQFEAPYHGL